MANSVGNAEKSKCRKVETSNLERGRGLRGRGAKRRKGSLRDAGFEKK